MSMIKLGGVASAEEELSVVIQCLKVRGRPSKELFAKTYAEGGK